MEKEIEKEIGNGMEKGREKRREKTNIKNDKKTINVLVAEDEKIMQILYEGVLKKLPVDYNITKDGKEGLGTFINGYEKGKAFDLVLSDINMPRMDGITMAREIRSYEKENNLKKTPLYAITAYEFALVKEKCFNAGYERVLGKESIVKDVNNILNEYMKNEWKNWLKNW